MKEFRFSFVHCSVKVDVGRNARLAKYFYHKCLQAGFTMPKEPSITPFERADFVSIYLKALVDVNFLGNVVFCAQRRSSVDTYSQLVSFQQFEYLIPILAQKEKFLISIEKERLRKQAIRAEEHDNEIFMQQR